MEIDWNIAQALSSVRQLDSVMDELSDEQLATLIELEEVAARRKVFLDKLFRESRQRARKQFIR